VISKKKYQKISEIQTSFPHFLFWNSELYPSIWVVLVYVLSNMFSYMVPEGYLDFQVFYFVGVLSFEVLLYLCIYNLH